MINRIQSIEDVIMFTKEIIAEGTRIHPDDDFREMVNMETDEPTYTIEEADMRNELMNQYFDICDKEGTDIYGIMLDVYQKEMGDENVITGSSKIEN